MEGQDDEGEEGEEDSEEESGEEEEEVGPRRVHPLRSVSMMRLARVVGVIGLLSSSTAAHAVSITNRDEHDHKVTIIEGDTKADHVLKPSQALNGICAKGCTIRLNDSEDDEYRLEADDVVSIEDGSLYYDGPGTPAGASARRRADQQAGQQGLELASSFARRPPATTGGRRVSFAGWRPGLGEADPAEPDAPAAASQVGPKRRSNAARSARPPHPGPRQTPARRGS